MDIGLIKYILFQLLRFYSFAVIVYVLMSWFPGARESRFGEVLGSVVEPYLEVFRKIIPPLGMIDISPIVALIVLQFASYGLLDLFRMFGL